MTANAKLRGNSRIYYHGNASAISGEALAFALLLGITDHDYYYLDVIGQKDRWPTDRMNTRDIGSRNKHCAPLMRKCVRARNRT